MARHDDLYISPKGFWPNPDQEPFYKCQTPPWEAPRKRKSGGAKSRYADLNNMMNAMNLGEEIITRNRYDLLNPDFCESENNMLKSDMKNNDGNYPAEKCDISNKNNMHDINCNLYSKYYMNDDIINCNGFDKSFAYMYNYKNDIYFENSCKLNKNALAGYPVGFISQNYLSHYTNTNYYTKIDQNHGLTSPPVTMKSNVPKYTTYPMRPRNTHKGFPGYQMNLLSHYTNTDIYTKIDENQGLTSPPVTMDSDIPKYTSYPMRPRNTHKGFPGHQMNLLNPHHRSPKNT